MIELLKTFIVVYETRNFSLAAKQLYKTQPTISLQIQRLEAELGFKLFERKGKQLILPTSAHCPLFFRKPKTPKILKQRVCSLVLIPPPFTYCLASWHS